MLIYAVNSILRTAAVGFDSGNLQIFHEAYLEN
jgi:hypothetical protein